ncbi:hypothetical protein H0H87_011166 [Tephrocybe sp. NHM501043]|nr:hypothetical protein H0H87_011166 [Tephrocybe sp. NHM501043]
MPASLNTTAESVFTVPDALLKGQMMTKVSEKKRKRVSFRLDPDAGSILYKSSKSGVVSLETVKEIRSGSGARYYREQFGLPEESEQRWLTLIYILDGAYKTLHMLADTRDAFIMWEAAIRKLVAVRQGLMTGLGNVDVRETIWTRQYWKGADGNGDRKLSLGEVERLCWRLNARFSKPELMAMFHDADPKNQGYLDFAGFQSFVRSLKRRPEIEQVYKDISDRNGGKFDFSTFEVFMKNTQHSTLAQDELKAMFAKYSSPKPEVSRAASPSAGSAPLISTPVAPESTSAAAGALQPPKVEVATPLVLTFEGFSSFLLSTDNAAFSEKDRGVWQDMTRPVSEYYVSSSHNTYLVGHQLIGVSTIEGYIRALLHSCRSVELDIYDGEVEPVVFHGKTFTSSVSVRDVCNAIAKYAFVTSPYPVLISAEIHCGIQQQDVLVNIMVEVFGEALIRAPVEGRPKLSALPSPEVLKGKVMLKAKNLYVVAQLEALHIKSPTATPPAQPVVLEAETSDESDDEDESNTQKISGEVKHGLQELKEKWRRVRGTSSTDLSTKKPKEKLKMSFNLASLLVYTVGVKCHGLGTEHGYAPEHIFSLSESKANKLLKGGTMRDMIKHTKDHMVRIYPKGTRVNSTNYEPHRFWAAGAQVVAINWQTFDLGYTMNQAMFQRNGRAGFVLKPDALRGKDELLSKSSNHIFEVTIISAHQLPRLKDSTGHEVVEKSIVDPLVEVTLHIPDWTHPPFALKTGLTSPTPPDSAVSPSSPRTVKVRTRAVRNNGFNPVWRETLEIPFDVIGGKEMQDLVFVQFSILEDDYDDEDDEPIAVYCTPLSCLEKGYRHLPLHDAQLSQYLFSTLFVQTQIRDMN